MESRETTVLPLLSFLIATYNRREVLLHTLEKLHDIDERSGLITEVLVIDNASTDGTADAIAAQFPEVRLFREKINSGACAKNVGLSQLQGQFVIFLDDDSYPDTGSVLRMIEYFQSDPKLGAAVFDVVLPDGSHECSAYPKVFIGCGTGFRRAALDEAGGLPENYFMQAEEYVLSLRLLREGWDIRRFEDLRVLHLKTPSSRQPARTTRLDVRNNLTFITRYFPRPLMMKFAVDWMRRYRWIAQTKGWNHRVAFWRGLAEGIFRSLRKGHRHPVSLAVFERFAMIREIETRLIQANRTGPMTTVLLIDVGKNIYPFWLATQSCGLKVIAIADPKLAGRKYRGIPIVDDATARSLIFDAAIVSNLSPIHSEKRREEWRIATPRPVIDLFEPPRSIAKAA